MQPIQLFQIAAAQAHWLSVRQDVVAGNVANANTPGYKAMDVEPFSSVLDKMDRGGAQGLAATSALHIKDDSAVGAVRTEPVDGGIALKPSGNSVDLAHELMRSGEIRREFELNTGVVRSFHQMMMMTVKS